MTLSDRDIEFFDTFLGKYIAQIIYTRDLLRMGRVNDARDNIIALRNSLEAIIIDFQEALQEQDDS